MILRSSWLQARIPFTVLLLPLFWIILLLSPNLNHWRALWVLFIIHGLLYSAVNIYLNFYNERTVLQNGFAVSKKLSPWWFYLAISIHTAAVILSAVKVNYTFAALVLLYGVTAHAYGISAEQRKKPSVFNWAFIRVFQGFVASLIYYSGLNGFTFFESFTAKAIVPGIIAGLLLAAFFTEEDRPVAKTDQGKNPVSLIKSVGILIIAAVISVWFFMSHVSSAYSAGIITAFAFGVVIILEKNESKKSARVGSRIFWINWLGAVALNIYAFYLFTDHTQVLQLIH